MFFTLCLMFSMCKLELLIYPSFNCSVSILCATIIVNIATSSNEGAKQSKSHKDIMILDHSAKFHNNCSVCNRCRRRLRLWNNSTRFCHCLKFSHVFVYMLAKTVWQQRSSILILPQDDTKNYTLLLQAFFPKM